MDRSFKEDGALGGATNDAYTVAPGNDWYLVKKFVFDNVYFMLIMIIMLNIVAGNFLHLIKKNIFRYHY